MTAGYARDGTTPALVHVDGGPDLYTPRTRADGNLDAMGLAHLLALPGTVPAAAAARARAVAEAPSCRRWPEP